MEDTPQDPGSTVPRRQLGRHLRQLREEAGLTVRATCAEMEWSGQKLWRIEKGASPVRALDVKNLCDLYGADQRTTEALMALAKETKAKGWWHAYGKTLPAWFDTYVGLEAAASHLRWYEAEVIPGLLQTRRYAEVAVRTGLAVSEQEYANRVEMRMQRRALLERRVPPPPQLDVVIGEPALLRTPPDRSVMREQLQHLIDVAQQPHITVRVLSLDAGFHHALDCGSRFTLLSFPATRTGPGEPPVVYSDSLTGAWYGDAPDEIRAYDDVWNRIVAASLPAEDSVKVVADLMERHR